MKSLITSLLLIVSTTNYCSADAEEPVTLTTTDTYKACDRNDLDLDQCLKNFIQEQILQNINGSKKFNIPQMEPWSLPRTKYLYRASTIRMALITEDVKIHGLKRTSVVSVNTKFQNNDETFMAETIILFPRIRMSGNYTANVRVNELKMRPKGKFNITLVNVINTIKLSGKIENMYNQRFLHLKKFTLEPLIEDIRFNITGVFPADQQLNNVFAQFINSYWRNLYPVVIRETRPDWEPMLMNATNDFLKNIPFNNIIKNSKL